MLVTSSFDWRKVYDLPRRRVCVWKIMPAMFFLVPAMWRVQYLVRKVFGRILWYFDWRKLFDAGIDYAGSLVGEKVEIRKFKPRRIRIKRRKWEEPKICKRLAGRRYFVKTFAKLTVRTKLIWINDNVILLRIPHNFDNRNKKITENHWFFNVSCCNQLKR